MVSWEQGIKYIYLASCSNGKIGVRLLGGISLFYSHKISCSVCHSVSLRKHYWIPCECALCALLRSIALFLPSNDILRWFFQSFYKCRSKRLSFRAVVDENLGSSLLILFICGSEMIRISRLTPQSSASIFGLINLKAGNGCNVDKWALPQLGSDKPMPGLLETFGYPLLIRNYQVVAVETNQLLHNKHIRYLGRSFSPTLITNNEIPAYCKMYSRSTIRSIGRLGIENHWAYIIAYLEW